jgi:hypothetical protein
VVYPFASYSSISLYHGRQSEVSSLSRQFEKMHGGRNWEYPEFDPFGVDLSHELESGVFCFTSLSRSKSRLVSFDNDGRLECMRQVSSFLFTNSTIELHISRVVTVVHHDGSVSYRK